MFVLTDNKVIEFAIDMDVSRLELSLCVAVAARQADPQELYPYHWNDFLMAHILLIKYMINNRIY